VVAEEPPPRENPAQVEATAQFSAQLVEGVPHLLTAQIGVDEDVCSVERVALRIVIVKEPAVGDARIGVGPVGVGAHVHDQTGDRANDPAMELGHDLALGKHADVIAELAAVPDDVLLDHRGETQLVEGDEAIEVGLARQAQRDGACGAGDRTGLHGELVPFGTALGNGRRSRSGACAWADQPPMRASSARCVALNSGLVCASA
jgi:hypothetical protein